MQIGLRASVGKAARRQVGACQVGQRAVDASERVERGGRLRRRAQQLACVGVGGAVAQLCRGQGFHQLARMHHRHALAALGGERQVVRDQQRGEAALPGQSGDQVEHTRLRAHVQPGRGLVGDQQFGLAGQCQRDHHALALAAGEFVRIRTEAASGVAQPDTLDPVERSLAGRRRTQAAVHAQHLLQLVADAAQWMQRTPRALEHEADVASAQGVPGACIGSSGRAEQVAALEAQALRLHLGTRVEQAGEHECRHGFPGAALADQRERLAGMQRQADPVEHVQRAGRHPETQAQCLDLEQRPAHGAASAAPRRSSTSRSASPSSAKQPTAANSASPGKPASHHWPVMM